MDRLVLITDWYTTIENFFIHNPEFGPFSYLVHIKRPIFNDLLHQ